MKKISFAQVHLDQWVFGVGETHEVRITMTEAELRQIRILLTDHVHLTNKEIEGYVEGTLDTESRDLVASHLESCPYCSKEVELIGESSAEPSQGCATDSDIPKAGVAADHQPGSTIRYDRFWLGDRSYPLEPSTEFKELVEIPGLSLADMLVAYKKDVREPGSIPIGVECVGRSAIVASLRSFRREGTSGKHGQELLPGFFEGGTVPVQSEAAVIPFPTGRLTRRRRSEEESSSLGAAAHDLSQRPEPSPHRRAVRSAALKVPPETVDHVQEKGEKPQLVFTGYGKNHSVEIFSDSHTGKVFLRIAEMDQVRPVDDTYEAFYGDFSLDWEAALAVVSLQFDLVREDVESTHHKARRKRKITWLKNWMAHVRSELGNVGGDSFAQEVPSRVDSQKIQTILSHLKENRKLAGLVLLEVLAFRPYEAVIRDRTVEAKGLFLERGTAKKFLGKLAAYLGFRASEVVRLDKRLKSITDAMTGRARKIRVALLIGVALGALILGISAPMIGGIVGKAMGFKGAAARMAGLAALGGGSIASGGWGTVGGTAVLVLSGAFLGLLGGGLTGSVIAGMTSELPFVQAAKLELGLREFVLGVQSDIIEARKLVFEQRHTIERMEEEIRKLRFTTGIGQARKLKELERTVEILKKSLERNESMVNSAA